MAVCTAGIFKNSEWQLKLYSLAHYFIDTYMSPTICTHKETCFPKVGSGRDPPQLQGEGVKYIHMHILKHEQKAAPQQRARAPRSHFA